MVMLADLLDDNVALHRVYRLIAQPGDRASGVAQAIAEVEALGRQTPHSATRDACRHLARALASLGALPPDESPEALALVLEQGEAAMDDPATTRDERTTLLLRQQLVRHRLRSLLPPPGPAIPRVIHLVKTDAGSGDLPLFQYLCYRSILAHGEGYRVVLHSPARPRGPRWEKLLPRLELDIAVPPQWLGNRRIVAAAHQSDAWRLKQVIRHGGFYFDWDVLLLRSPDALREHVCVMALERKEEGYDEVLGVSVIGAAPGSQFLTAWLEAMPAVFNPARYVAHSTVLARELAIELPSLVRVLDHRAFYHPGWSEAAMRWLFDPAECLPRDELHEHLAACTGIHLFCSHAHFMHWANDMTEKDIEKPRCNLAILMQPHL